MALRRLLMNLVFNDQVINKLSNTRPIRLLARLCASLYMEGRAIAQDPALKHGNPKVIRDAMKQFSAQFSKTAKNLKDEFKNK